MLPSRPVPWHHAASGVPRSAASPYVSDEMAVVHTRT